MALDDGQRVAVEVKTITDGAVDPLRTFTDEKANQVKRLAHTIGCRRCDLVVVEVTAEGAYLRWLPNQ